MAVNFYTDINADAFVKDGGTSSQYLMADGSVSAGNSSGVISIAASTVDGKEGIEVTNGTSAAVVVGLDLDSLEGPSWNNLVSIAGIDSNGKNAKDSKNLFFAAYQYIGYINGNGSTTSFSITHDLGLNYLLQVIDVNSSSNTYREEVFPKVVRTNATTVTVSFNTAPANNQDYDVFMSKINQRPL